LPSLSACRCPALHVACCPRPPLFSCRRPRRRCRRAPLLLNQSSSPDAVITISPLVPPSFVDCCFKRRAKPLLPTMVPSLSSGLPSLVGCFCCPPPPTLAASHSRRHTSSPVRYPHSWRFNVTVVVAGSSRHRCDAAGGGTTAAAAAVGDDACVRLRVILVPPSPQSRALTVGDPAQVFPPKKVFFGWETTFSEAQKTLKKQTDAEQREALFSTKMRIAPPTTSQNCRPTHLPYDPT
jgi:hypothetical protein